MYPVLKEGVSIGTFQYEGSDTTHYYIENANGEEFEISHRLWVALLQADGTRPLNLPNNGHRVLPKLKRLGLVRTSRFIQDDGIFNRFILFPIRNRKQSANLLCRRINSVLPMLSILIFVISVILMVSNDFNTAYYFNWWLYYGLVISSIACHEIGHLIAGIAYGYNISDMGILLLGVIPVGAYVSHEDKENSKKGEEIQFALAGIEINLLIAGICLLVAMCHYSLFLTMAYVANFNIITACINLLPSSGLDGESALSAICGIKDISQEASKWITNRKRRRKLFNSGLPGYIGFGIFAFVLIAKILFWLFVGLNVILILLDIFL